MTTRTVYSRALRSRRSFSFHGTNEILGRNFVSDDRALNNIKAYDMRISYNNNAIWLYRAACVATNNAYHLHYWWCNSLENSSNGWIDTSIQLAPGQPIAFIGAYLYYVSSSQSLYRASISENGISSEFVTTCNFEEAPDYLGNYSLIGYFVFGDKRVFIAKQYQRDGRYITKVFSQFEGSFVETCTFETAVQYGNFDAVRVNLGRYRYWNSSQVTREDHLIVCAPLSFISGNAQSFSGLTTVILDRPVETFMEPIFTWTSDVDVFYYPKSLSYHNGRIYLLGAYHYRQDNHRFLGYAYAYDRVQVGDYIVKSNFQFSRTNDFYITDSSAQVEAVQTRGEFLQIGGKTYWWIIPFGAEALIAQVQEDSAVEISYSQVALQNEINGMYAGKITIDDDSYQQIEPREWGRSEIDLRIWTSDQPEKSVGKFRVFDIENTKNESGTMTTASICQRDIYALDTTPADGFLYYRNPNGNFFSPYDSYRNSLPYGELILQYKNPETAPVLEIIYGGTACKLYSEPDIPYEDRFTMGFSPNLVYNPTIHIRVGVYQYQRGEYGWGFSLGMQFVENRDHWFIAVVVTTIPTARYKIYEVKYSNYSYSITHLATIADTTTSATDDYLLLARGSLIEVYKGITVNNTKTFKRALRFRYHRLGIFEKYYAGVSCIPDEYAWAAHLSRLAIADGSFPVTVADSFATGANIVGSSILERPIEEKTHGEIYDLGNLNQYIPNAIDYIGCRTVSLESPAVGKILQTNDGLHIMQHGYYKLDPVIEPDEYAYPVRICSNGGMAGVWVWKTPLLVITTYNTLEQSGYLYPISAQVLPGSGGIISLRDPIGNAVPPEFSIDPGRSILSSLSYLLDDYELFLATLPDGIFLSEFGAREVNFNAVPNMRTSTYSGVVPSVLQVEGIEVTRTFLYDFARFGIVYHVESGIFDTRDGQIWKMNKIATRIRHSMIQHSLSVPITGQWYYPGSTLVSGNKKYFLHSSSMVLYSSGVSFTADYHLNMFERTTYEED